MFGHILLGPDALQIIMAFAGCYGGGGGTPPITPRFHIRFEDGTTKDIALSISSLGYESGRHGCYLISGHVSEKETPGAGLHYFHGYYKATDCKGNITFSQTRP